MTAVIKKLLVSSLALAGVAGLLLLGGVIVNGTVSAFSGGTTSHDPGLANADRLFVEGRHVFRFDTFGDEAVWGGVLGLHRAIEGSKLGGVGPGLSPKDALALGLKVDVAAIPPNSTSPGRAGRRSPGPIPARCSKTTPNPAGRAPIPNRATFRTLVPCKERLR